MCDPDRVVVMLRDHLTCACEGCGRALTDESLMLVLTDRAGERRAYECACSVVTVTVVR